MTTTVPEKELSEPHSPAAFFTTGSRYVHSTDRPGKTTISRHTYKVSERVIQCTCFDYDKSHLCDHLRDVYSAVAWTQMLGDLEYKALNHMKSDFMSGVPILSCWLPVSYDTMLNSPDSRSSPLIRMMLNVMLATSPADPYHLDVYLLTFNKEALTTTFDHPDDWILLGTILSTDGVDRIWDLIFEYAEGARARCQSIIHKDANSFLPSTNTTIEEEHAAEAALDERTPGRYRFESLCAKVTKFCWTCLCDAMGVAFPDEGTHTFHPPAPTYGHGVYPRIS